jgi:tRNA threonylcarbamoyl adenosine modification protein YjeE
MEKKEVHSEGEMEQLGKEIAVLWQLGKFAERNIFSLEGVLGAGKTVFARGVAKGLKIKERVDSPTFVILKQYGNFYHFDLYRLKNSGELLNLGWEEIISQKNNLVMVEWGDKVEDLLKRARGQVVKVRFEIKNEKRELFFEKL